MEFDPHAKKAKKATRNVRRILRLTQIPFLTPRRRDAKETIHHEEHEEYFDAMDELTRFCISHILDHLRRLTFLFQGRQ